jgi:hypothetical protein
MSRFQLPVYASKNSVPDSVSVDGFDDWVGSWQFGPYCQTAEIVVNWKQAVSVGIFAGIVPLF